MNDASPDGVLDVLIDLARCNEKISVIDLSRNVGKAAAVLAGMSRMTGEAMVLLDDDGQCPVDRLWDLLAPIEAGHDMAVARYPKKKQAWWKNLGSKVNSWLIKLLVGQPKDVEFSNFNIRRRFVCDEMRRYGNPYPNLQGLTLRATHDIVGVPMEERERISGQSNYTFWKSLKLLVNGCTTFSVAPLRIASLFGVLFSLVGVCAGIWAIVNKLLNPTVPVGYTSTVAIMLFVGGVVMLLLGIIGEYLGRIYVCINASPQYVVRREWGPSAAENSSEKVREV